MRFASAVVALGLVALDGGVSGFAFSSRGGASTSTNTQAQVTRTPVFTGTFGKTRPYGASYLQSSESGVEAPPPATEEISAETTKEEAVSTEESADDAVEAEAEKEEPLVLEEVPPASFEVTSSKTGPGGGQVHTLTVHLGFAGHPEPIVIETGKIGRQAAGAVTLRRGDTVLYATAAHDKDPKTTIDFLPLSVEYSERFSSAGVTSGSYNKRDGRPAEHEVLTCRLIDRPLRPLISEGWRHETQLLTWVLSYDGQRSCNPLAITASAASLWISDVPLLKPVAAANVGYIDGQLVLNPTNEQMEKSRLDLTVAGTKDAVLMIEGAADFLPEEIMMEAVTFGHKAIQVLCNGLEELGKAVGQEKKYDTLPQPVEGLQAKVDALYSDKIDAMYQQTADKSAQSSEMSKLSKEVVAVFEEEYPEEKNAIKGAFKNLLCRRMFHQAKETGLRCDGRKVNEVRQIDIEAGLLPRVHGSALFTRGETQAVATATLGDSGMKQKIDKLDGLNLKRFYLQYTFPPSCVGETGRVGMPGRREVGHGNLAERALIPILPSEEAFPYSIRVESLITESHGSSSMASVCGGCLALMDAGVPIKTPVAGIAMGMLLGDKGGLSDENAVIVSDILGTEDALGTMDFKVAGDRIGITTFQLDIKCEGLTLETMGRALEQAREGRLHILDEMEKALPAYRTELPPTIPRMSSFSIPEDSIGKVIGPGGKQIRAVIEDFQLTNMDVREDGTIQITSMDTKQMEAAEAFVKNLVASSAGGGRGGGRGGPREPKPAYVGPEAVEGQTYKGKITGIHNFGVFLEIIPGPEDGSSPGLEGLCHVSELHVERVRNCEGFVGSMNTDVLDVKYIGRNAKGQLQLSRKAVMEERNGKGRPPSSGNPQDPPKAAPKMEQGEINAIVEAIEGIENL